MAIPFYTVMLFGGPGQWSATQVLPGELWRRLRVGPTSAERRGGEVGSADAAGMEYGISVLWQFECNAALSALPVPQQALSLGGRAVDQLMQLFYDSSPFNMSRVVTFLCKLPPDGLRVFARPTAGQLKCALKGRDVWLHGLRGQL
jgi:hypothetical protein